MGPRFGGGGSRGRYSGGCSSSAPASELPAIPGYHRCVSARSQLTNAGQACAHTSPIDKYGLLCEIPIESIFEDYKQRLRTRYHTWFG